MGPLFKAAQLAGTYPCEHDWQKPPSSKGFLLRRRFGCLLLGLRRTRFYRNSRSTDRCAVHPSRREAHRSRASLRFGPMFVMDVIGPLETRIQYCATSKPPPDALNNRGKIYCSSKSPLRCVFRQNQCWIAPPP